MSFSELEVINQKENIWETKSSIGMSITTALKDAISLASENNINIKFEFNGVNLLVNKSDTLEDLTKEYHNALSKNHNEYMNTIEAKKSQYKFEQRKVVAQKRGEELLKNFDEALSSESKLIKWLGEFSSVTNDIALNYDPKELANKMKEKGFNYEFPKNKKEYTQKELLAISVLGNSYIALSKGEIINHVAARFAKEYEEVEKKEKTIERINKTNNQFKETDLKEKIKNSL